MELLELCYINMEPDKHESEENMVKAEQDSAVTSADILPLTNGVAKKIKAPKEKCLLFRTFWDFKTSKMQFFIQIKMKKTNNDWKQQAGSENL